MEIEMATYLVRLQESNELVGIFWAENLFDLAFCIDEATDPYSCEYKKLAHGGIFWPRPIDVSIPLKDFDCDNENPNYDINPISEALIKSGVPDISEYLSDDLFSSKGWKKYDIKQDL
jgi:hypothetical protein